MTALRARPNRFGFFAATLLLVSSFLASLSTVANAQSISPFLGTYSGSAELEENGTLTRRDMSVEITETDDGFSVSWTSGTYKPDGRIKEKSYTIEFVASDRDDIFASAMQTNVFGKQVPLDPLKGEPFVWSRIVNDTLTVFSLFINEGGDYEMQEYHRTLTDGGLNLDFNRFYDGVKVRAVNTFLKRES
jgi:hypothetical protein